MIKVITTVGTSLFTNYMRKEVQKYWQDKADSDAIIQNFNIETNYKSLLKEQNGERAKNATKTAIDRYWLNGIETYVNEEGDLECTNINGLNRHCCAEVQTLLAIANKNEYEGEPFCVYLLCTNTTLSKLAAKIIAEIDFAPVANITFHCFGDDKFFPIEGLQVKDAETFRDAGFINLIDKVVAIKGEDTSTILNISGGYKALIPPLTLLAQLEQIPLYYIYEDSGELIETGNLPINFDWGIIEEYIIYLHNKNKRNNAKDDVIVEMRKLRLIKPNSRELSIIGNLLAKYSNQASPFTQNIFGYLVEHKLDECYAVEYGREKVQHGVKFGEMKGSEDIDIFIKPTESEFITMEVKHAGFVLENDEQMKKIATNLIFRAKQANLSGQGEIKEIWLMLYSYTNETTRFVLSEAQIETLNEVSKMIKEDAVCKKATFKAKHFYIKSNKLGGESHVYQTFMKSTIKHGDISDIYVSQ